MNVAEAKEQILALITTLKLTEKKIRSLQKEADSYKSQIEFFRKQLPALAARERNIDLHLLEKELLLALGRTEEENKTEKAFKKMDNISSDSIDEALQALKDKMNLRGDIS